MAEKLKMHSINKVDENIRRIGELFPNCLTEVKDEDETAEADQNEFSFHLLPPVSCSPSFQ